MVPEEWGAGVHITAPIPHPTAETGEWVAFANTVAGGLEDANGRYKMSMKIVSQCERRDDELVKSLTHKLFLGIF